MNCTNQNEESSLVDNAAPMSANFRVIEDLSTNTFETTPLMLDAPKPNRSGLHARLIGGSGIGQQNITERMQMFSSDALPSLSSEEQRLQFQSNFLIEKSVELSSMQSFGQQICSTLASLAVKATRGT